MDKGIFHNSKLINDDFKTKNSYPKANLNQKRNPDINKLLNRVKLNQLIEKKKQDYLLQCRNFINSLYGAFYINYKISRYPNYLFALKIKPIINQQ